MLTPRQRDVLVFIETYQGANDGVSPTLREMGARLLFGSTSGVHAILTELEERGYIRRLKGRARAIEVLRSGRALTPGDKSLLGRLYDRLKRIEEQKRQAITLSNRTALTRLEGAENEIREILKEHRIRTLGIEEGVA